MRACGVSRYVRPIRPTAGTVLVVRRASTAAASGPIRSNLANAVASRIPTRSRTARHSSATVSNQPVWRNETMSCGGQAGRCREPLGPLPAVDLREHRPLAVQAPVEGGGAVGATGRALQCGQRCLVAVLVVLGPLHPAVGHDVAAVDVAEPACVVRPHAHAGGAVDHPAGQLPAQARTVGDPDLHADHLPEVGHPRRAQQGLAVGRVRDRAADHLLDAQRLQHRHPLERPGQPESHPVEVGVEQRVLQRPVRPVAVMPDRFGTGLLVDADQA